MNLLLLLIILFLLFGGGGYYGYNRGMYGGRSFGGAIGLLLVVLIVIALLGHGPLFGPHV